MNGEEENHPPNPLPGRKGRRTRGNSNKDVVVAGKCFVQTVMPMASEKSYFKTTLTGRRRSVKLGKAFKTVKRIKKAKKKIERLEAELFKLVEWMEDRDVDLVLRKLKED